MHYQCVVPSTEIYHHTGMIVNERNCDDGPVTEASPVGRPPKLWIQGAVIEGICNYCKQPVTTKNTTRIKKVTTSVLIHFHWFSNINLASEDRQDVKL